METITKERFIKTLREKGVALFNYEDLYKLFNVNSNSTLYNLLSRLKKAQIIESLMRGKYYFNFSSSPPSDFSTANFICDPSYVSLESALSFYDLINQFPYQITSVTPEKTKTFLFGQKKFSFTHLKSEFFTDYVKKDDFLIATPIKAIFDFVYLVYKGSRSKENLDLLIFPRDGIVKNEFANYLKNMVERFGEKKLWKFCQNQKLI